MPPNAAADEQRPPTNRQRELRADKPQASRPDVEDMDGDTDGDKIVLPSDKRLRVDNDAQTTLSVQSVPTPAPSPSTVATEAPISTLPQRESPREADSDGLKVERPVSPLSITPSQSKTTSLTTLPTELIMEIANWLDPPAFLNLACAWRPFLHGFARSLDPWEPIRLNLHRMIQDEITRQFVDPASPLRRMLAPVCFGAFTTRQVYCMALLMFSSGYSHEGLPETSAIAAFRAIADYRALDVYRYANVRHPMVPAPLKYFEILDIWDAVERLGLPIVDPLYDHPQLRFKFRWILDLDNSHWSEENNAHFARMLVHKQFPLIGIGVEEGYHVDGRLASTFEHGLRTGTEQLTELQLTECTIDDEHLSAIIKAARDHPALQVLAVTCKQQQSVDAMLDLLRCPTNQLHTLDLTSSKLSFHDMVGITDALAAGTTQLRTLDLSSCSDIDVPCAHIIGKMLMSPQCPLLKLVLYNNTRLGSAGIGILAKALSAKIRATLPASTSSSSTSTSPSISSTSPLSPRLEHLDVSCTNCGKRGIEALARMLYVNRTLRVLSVAANVQLGRRGDAIICEMESKHRARGVRIC